MQRVARFIGAALTLLSWLGAAGARATPSDDLTPQTPLAPSAIPRYVQPLPVLDLADEPLWTAYPRIATVLPAEVDGDEPFTLRMCEFQAAVLPAGTPVTRPTTSVWGYSKTSCPTGPRDTYIGPVFVALRGTPTSIRFVNDLPSTPEESAVIAYRDSVDQTLHWADPGGLMCAMNDPMEPLDEACASPFRGSGIPAVPHLHGGEVPPMLDGGPEAWFTSDGVSQGAAYYTDPRFEAAGNESVYTYPNTQEAAPIWFHDHTLGATRLNVFAGLAGGYYVVDPQQQLPEGLDQLQNVVPVVLQDRMFDTDGELFFTSGSKGGTLWALNPEHPYWNPEFVGDAIVVNGKAWPYLEVEQKRYRFLFLNGSNARTYELFLVDRVTKVAGPPMYVISTDGGYLDAAVKIDPNAAKPAQTKLVIMPGERYEVVIDFSQVPVGSRLWLKNVAKTPYPGGATPTGGLDQLMELRVSCPPGAVVPCDPSGAGIAFDPSSAPTIRGAPMPPLVDFGTGQANVAFDEVRQLTLNEVMGMPMVATDPVTGALTAFPGGPLEVLVNNTKWAGSSREDFLRVGSLWYSELPQEGDTELWEIVNLTADSHPIHLHLAQFQIVNRQAFDLKKYDAAYNQAFPGGAYLPGEGPPLDYFTGTPGKLGGNPDVTPFLKGPRVPAAGQERGWKDTVQAPPGIVTRIAVRWAPTDLAVGTASASLHYPFDPSGVVGDEQYGFVWHCHIIDHEDNEMMRPDLIQVNPASPPAAERPLVQGEDY